MYLIQTCTLSIYYIQVGQQDRTASCKLCAAGKANAQFGQTAIGACLDCDKGRYGTLTGQASCIACTAGRYRDTLAGK